MKKRTAILAFALAFLMLLSCISFVGCRSSVSGKEISTDATGDSDSQKAPDILIKKIVNNEGGVINVYYTVRQKDGETWEGEIRFDPNGGEAPEGATMAWESGKEYYNLACPFVRDEYEFFGWSLEKDGDPYIYKTNDRFSAYPISDIVALAKANNKDGDLTFYAIWKPIEANEAASGNTNVNIGTYIGNIENNGGELNFYAGGGN